MRKETALLLALMAVALVFDVIAWAGPRNCPACGGRRSLRERARGYHSCDWTAARA
jgi:hypothetical protein